MEELSKAYKILCAFLVCPIRATWPAHFMPLDFTLIIIISEEYNYVARRHCAVSSFLVLPPLSYVPQPFLFV
jgi:hypothetical protein